MFVEQYGRLIDASAKGQTLMQKIVQAHLKRLEWKDNLASRLYPFTRARGVHSPKSVLMDPRFCFGRPVLSKSHVATAIIAERYKAGDSIDELVEDYGCAPTEIQ